MAFSPMTIPGVTGPVTTEYSFWKGYKFFVDGQRVKPQGFPRNKLQLPGTDGPVEAKIKGGLFRAHPILVIDGQEYTSGPPTPTGLQVLGMLPVVSILILQGALGFLLAFGAVALNMGTVRGSFSTGTKIALMVATLVAVLAIDAAVLVAFIQSQD